ncbi:unnamed protein product, partial [Durusdinium trenchii]
IAVRKLHFTPANTGLEDNNYPELGTAWKAAHVKLALWYITKPARDFAEERDDPILEVGASCSWALLSAIESMDAAGLIMTEEQAVQTHQGLMEHLHCWHAMRASCISAAVKRFKNSRDEKHHSTGKRRRNSVSSLL